MDDQEVQRLVDVANVTFGHPFSSSEFNNDKRGLPLIRIRDLGADEVTVYTTQTDYPASAEVRTGELLVGMDAEFSPYIWRLGRSLLNQRVCRLEPKSTLESDRVYLRAALLQPLTELQNSKSATTVIHLNKSDLERIHVRWPHFNQRAAIANTLGALDDKIELNRRMNATLEAMARALFQSWFVDFDPVRAKAEGRQPVGMDAETAALFPDSFEDSALGPIPTGWEAGQLSNLAQLNPEAWSNSNRPETLQYVDLSNTKWGRIESITPFLNTEAPSRAQRVLRVLDTIVGTVRPGNGSYALVTVDGLTGSTGFAALRPLATHSAEFVYLAATSVESIDVLAQLADGGAYPAVRPEVVAGLKVVIPSANVLSAFSSRTRTLFSLTSKNERQSGLSEKVRDQILPKLLSGELRVGEVVV